MSYEMYTTERADVELDGEAAKRLGRKAQAFASQACNAALKVTRMIGIVHPAFGLTSLSKEDDLSILRLCF